MPLPDGWYNIAATPDLFDFLNTPAGTYTSANLSAEGITLYTAIVTVYASRIDSGTTLDFLLQVSDDGITWTPAPGAATPAMTATGSAITAVINPGGIAHLRGMATITGGGLVSATATALVTIR